MKILFAVSNDRISESVVKRYQKEYKEIVTYKNVYYFKSILNEVQKDKTYDRLIISEELEDFGNTQLEKIDQIIYEKLENIVDETSSLSGDIIPVILITSDRRKKGEEMLSKLYELGIYDALIGTDRSTVAVCQLIRTPRTKKEAMEYYKIRTGDNKNLAQSENDVSEQEIQNILAHYKKLGKNEDKYVTSFDNIVAQYNDAQLRIISKFLPLNVRAVLEEKSPKYKQIMAYSGNSAAKEMKKVKQIKQPVQNIAASGKLLKTDNRNNVPRDSIIIPSAVNKANVKKLAKKHEPENDFILDNTENIASDVQEINNNDTLNVDVPKVDTPIENNAQIIENEIKTNEFEKIDQIEQISQELNENIEKEVKRGRGRPRKVVPVAENAENLQSTSKRGRGRPRKNPIEQDENVSNKSDEELAKMNDVMENNNGQEFNSLDNNQDELLPGFNSNNDVLPGIDSNDELLPGFNSEENDESVLPGFNSEENDESVLPGFNSEENDENNLPEFNSVDNNENVWPETNEIGNNEEQVQTFNDIENNNDLLDELDNHNKNTNQNNYTVNNELILPGFENMNFENDSNDSLLPGFENVTSGYNVGSYSVEELDSYDPDAVNVNPVGNLNTNVDSNDYNFLNDIQDEDSDNSNYNVYNNNQEYSNDYTSSYDNLENDNNSVLSGFDYSEDNTFDNQENNQYSEYDDTQTNDNSYEQYEDDNTEEDNSSILPGFDYGEDSYNEFNTEENNNDEYSEYDDPETTEGYDSFNNNIEENSNYNTFNDNMEENSDYNSYNDLQEDNNNYNQYEENTENNDSSMLPGFEYEEEDSNSYDPLNDLLTDSQEEVNDGSQVIGVGMNTSSNEDYNSYDSTNNYNSQSNYEAEDNYNSYNDKVNDSDNSYNNYDSGYNSYEQYNEQPVNNYSYSNVDLSEILTSDKKIIAVVGTSKNGTSFIVNNLAEYASSVGINVAVLDTTRNKNSYYIYTKNEERLRKTAENCLECLINGQANGISVNRNLTVYTSLPEDRENLSNAGRILETIVKNHKLVLIDCDFDTPFEYFSYAQEICLVQSLDILTIQPLTAFLRDLKGHKVLDESKIRIILNKYVRVRGISEKTIIGGMSKYTDPAMSFMTDLFDINNAVKNYMTVQFEPDIYTRYLESIIECDVSIKGYSKSFLQKLKDLCNWLYSSSSANNTYRPPSAPTYENTTFSASMNNTLDQMKKKY